MITVELVKGAIQLVEVLRFSDGRAIKRTNNNKTGKSIVYKTPEHLRDNSKQVWAPSMRH